jgi:hypothetical protein
MITDRTVTMTSFPFPTRLAPKPRQRFLRD